VSAKVVRNLDTPEAREFWKSVEENAAVVDKWPWWKRGQGRCTSVKGTVRAAFRCELAVGHRCRHRYVKAKAVVE
jgi:hypothetical protein